MHTEAIVYLSIYIYIYIYRVAFEVPRIIRHPYNDKEDPKTDCNKTNYPHGPLGPAKHSPDLLFKPAALAFKSAASGWGFRVQGLALKGIQVQGFRGLGFRGLGFRGLGFRGLGGFGVM